MYEIGGIRRRKKVQPIRGRPGSPVIRSVIPPTVPETAMVGPSTDRSGESMFLDESDSRRPRKEPDGSAIDAVIGALVLIRESTATPRAKSFDEIRHHLRV